MRLPPRSRDALAQPDLVVTENAANSYLLATSVREVVLIAYAFPIDGTIPDRRPQVLVPVANQKAKRRHPSPVPSTQALSGAEELIPTGVGICWRTGTVWPAIVHGGEQDAEDFNSRLTDILPPRRPERGQGAHDAPNDRTGKHEDGFVHILPFRRRDRDTVV